MKGKKRWCFVNLNDLLQNIVKLLTKLAQPCVDKDPWMAGKIGNVLQTYTLHLQNITLTYLYFLFLGICMEVKIIILKDVMQQYF